MLRKITLTALSWLLFGTGLTASWFEVTNHISRKGLLSNEEKALREMIRKDIKDNSQNLGFSEIYNFEGIEYNDKDSIIKELLINNPIEAVQTSSDPMKIIKNYENGILDESLIYDLNFDDYVQVYKNALGNVVLPSCEIGESDYCVDSDESTLDRAFKSYINPGLTKKKFSYTLGNHNSWFDTTEEAAQEFIKTNYSVKEGLFYKVNGSYYNAFNKNDIKSMISNESNFKKGFYYHGEGLGGQPFYGEQSDFESTFKSRLSKVFREEINNIFSTDTDIKIVLSPGRGTKKQWFANPTKYKEGDGFSLKVDDGLLKIVIKNSVRERGFDFLNFKKALTGISTTDYWTKEFKRSNCVWKDNTKKISKFDYVLNGKNIHFELDTENFIPCVHGFNDTNYKNISINEIKPLSPNLNVSKNINNPFLKKISQTPVWNKINSMDLNELVNRTNNKNTFLSKDIIEASVYGKSKPSNWLPEIQNELFEYFFEHVWNFVSSDKSELNPVIGDYIYGAGSYSIEESHQYYVNNILNDVLKPVNENDLTELIPLQVENGVFETTYENWNKNFTYLHSNNSGIKLQKKYYLESSKADSLLNFSDQDGDNIANSIQEANTKMRSRQNMILRKRLFIYDLSGNLVVSDDDEENAYKKLKNNLNIKSKWIHKNEAKDIKLNEKAYNQIISNGLYTVYRFKNNFQNYIYFYSFDSALKNYEYNSYISEKVKIDLVQNFEYTYYKNNKKKKINWSSRDNLEDLINIIIA